MNPLLALQYARQGLSKPLLVQRDFVCLQCRHRAARAASVTTSGVAAGRTQRNVSTSSSAAASTTPFTERLRKRIWGTNEPPGSENPYGEKSVLDSVKAKRDAERVKDLGPRSEPLQDDYVPSKSWEGLEHIGGATGWWEDAWDQENQFQGSV